MEDEIMKQFEVGKTYKVKPYSFTMDGRRDYKHPETMVVVKRTETHIWCEIHWGIDRVMKKTCKLLKIGAVDAEAINCGVDRVTANSEA
jgi:hypothetical protein